MKLRRNSYREPPGPRDGFQRELPYRWAPTLLTVMVFVAALACQAARESATIGEPQRPTSESVTAEQYVAALCDPSAFIPAQASAKQMGEALEAKLETLAGMSPPGELTAYHDAFLALLDASLDYVDDLPPRSTVHASAFLSSEFLSSRGLTTVVDALQSGEMKQSCPPNHGNR